jgi:hypothetical protein
VKITKEEQNAQGDEWQLEQSSTIFHCAQIQTRLAARAPYKGRAGTTNMADGQRERYGDEITEESDSERCCFSKMPDWSSGVQVASAAREDLLTLAQ